jgi:hypothetical protein
MGKTVKATRILGLDTKGSDWSVSASGRFTPGTLDRELDAAS